MSVSDFGGDPACWLHRVCDDCGTVIEGEAAHDCPDREAHTDAG